MKPEKQLEKQIEQIAGYFGCAYFKIPDSKSINRDNRHFHREEKRPFDGILVTPFGNYCIECKINSRKLLTHQSKNERIINEINQSFFVIRKRIRKYNCVYQIEQPERNVVFETGKIEDLFEWFKERRV